MWPHRIRSRSATGIDMFCPERSKSSLKADHWKCGISEGLSMYPVLAHWVREIVLPSGVCNDACEVFLKLCTCINRLWNAGKKNISHDRISQAATDFLTSFAKVFGTDVWFWKFHCILHHAAYVQRYGWSPTTTTHERKHKSILKFASEQHIDNCYVL